MLSCCSKTLSGIDNLCWASRSFIDNLWSSNKMYSSKNIETILHKDQHNPNINCIFQFSSEIFAFQHLRFKFHNDIWDLTANWEKTLDLRICYSDNHWSPLYNSSQHVDDVSYIHHCLKEICIYQYERVSQNVCF